MKNSYYKKISLLVFTFLCSFVTWSQTVSYTAMTTIVCPATPTATISPAVPGLTFTQISRGSGVTCTTAAGSISGSGFNGTLAANITANKWYTYDVTSDATVSFSVTSLSIVSRVSSVTGSPNVSVQYSIDGGAKTVIGSFTPTTSATTYTITPGSAIAVGASQTLNIFIIPNALTASGTTCRVENNTSITLTTTPTTSNTITTSTALTGSPYCVSASAGTSVSVPFTSVGTFNIGNVYTAQLSNASGAFGTPVNIGTLSLDGANPSGSINATIPAGTVAGIGYRIRVVSNNPVVTGSNNTVDLTVQNGAAISAQPSVSTQTYCQGASATALSVTASGSSLTYQWYSNSTATNSGGTPVGTNSASYTPVTTTVGTLYYYCVVSAVCGTPVTSNVSGAITVNAIPSAPSGTINVSANPSCGAATLSYSVPSANIFWQTTASGTLTGSPTTTNYVSSTTAGSYTIYVRELSGTCWSPAISVTFTVVASVSISVQPTSQNATVGNTATFSVTAANASSYQWQVNTGSGFVNIGTNSNSYTTPATTLGMSGYLYQVIISGNAPCGTVTSSTATLNVTTGPCLSENFDASTAIPSGWTNGGSSNDAVASHYQSAPNCRALINGSNVISDVVNNPISISFYVDASGSGGQLGTLEYRVGAGAWTFVGNFTATTVGATETFNLTSSPNLSLFSNVSFRISSAANTIYIDNFNVFCGTPTGPEINVTGNTFTIFDGDTTPTTGDNTNFGSNPVSTNVVKTYVIQNIGTTDLTLSLPITLSDVSAPQEFVITQPSSATVAAGNSVSFTVTFNSAISGIFTNTININNNDTDEALYNYDIIATATTTTTVGTVFKPGELIFVGYDGQVFGSGQEDEYLVATLVDILPGTQFKLVNSRYEAGAAANVRTDKWGSGGDDPSDAPYEAIITYNGVANIPAGAVLRLETDGSGSWFGQVDVTVGTTTTDRTSDFSGSPIPTAIVNPNISSSGSDQIYLLQGDFVFDGTNNANQANYYLNGTLLHGLTNRAAWVPLSASCSGATTGGNTRESRLHASLTCFNVENVGASTISAFYENDKQHGIATIRQIVQAVSDVANNWTLSTGRYTIDASSNSVVRAGKTFQIGLGNPVGQWVGDVDTNWFNCANWEGLAVPKSTTDVLINGSAINFANIDFNAAYSDEYSDLATCNSLNITGSKVQIQGSLNNKLEVYGNLSLSGAGAIDMDDSNNATEDGQIYLYGNWTNSIGNSAFSEGNGTVVFTGSTPQIISNVTPEGTETFHHVILNNDFNTSVSNDLIANGNLTVNATKSLTITSNDFVEVQNNITNNGTLDVLNNGSLVQIDDAGVNTGNVFVKRTANIRLQDYSYWSSPVSSAAGTPVFPITSVSPSTPLSVIWKWGPASLNANGGEGMWLNTTENMVKGTGYAVRGPSGTSNATTTPLNTNFVGVPNNGVIPVTISRGNDLNAGTAGPNGIMRTIKDDNFNLIGNPYPSAIDADLFIARYGVVSSPDYADIEGSVRIWSHNTLPLASNADPFYANYQMNYSANDYITYNSLGSQIGPAMYLGKIPSGQGFFVLMKDGAAGTNTINFRNVLRSRTFDNSQFFRTTNSNTNVQNNTVEKHRIWLDIISPANSVTRTLFGYATGATNELDNTFDAITDSKMSYNLYSIVNNEVLTIQGRALPFKIEDTVQMGVKIASPGLYKIAIAATDGIFSNSNNNGQKIYLEDKDLNIIHDLTVGPYEFNGVQGTYNSRFIIRYNNGVVLANETFQTNNDVVIVSNQELSVVSSKEKIKSILVYDVLGRKLFDAKDINATNFILPISKRNAPLVIEIGLENEIKISKKTVY